ncbi:aldehyde dehydrogenase [Flavobacterium turcicum]|uniref:Aldehyde dehydrogenase n=1 Tax=Flavobacterium turcicum TaxID=2764718 RepID=A0ABR7JDR7_9FLAO|nr:aldehyde dehydrogenase [Flavobacterium turcicum]MBC5862594.1 aldehyde dehydrogenase [Flavobacterium turcicum]NHL01326.1 aldehyde dehydrogenase [Flavobacterium turcicum]
MKYTTDLGYRKESLKKLLDVITQHEDEIIKALYDDFKKPDFEAVLTETNYVISDLKATIKNFDSYTKPKKVRASLLNFPSSDYIYSEPYGHVLILSPWNYPFQLAFCPLVAAVAAGNAVTLKPSELTPKTAAIIAKIVRLTFTVQHVVVVTGDAKVAADLLEKRWDYIFFTGSVAVGKIVAKAAAKHLTPVTLELGGKSPCIVDETANIKISARRIIWGKIVNAGQTCVAPDYVLVHESVKQQLIEALRFEITAALGENPQESPDYARIINQKNWERQLQLLENQSILFGGQSDKNSFYVAPTLVDEPAKDSLLMTEEIFGPILPIISYTNISEVDQIINSYEKPLALYLFSENKKYVDYVLQNHSFGGGCINDTVVHLVNEILPFGGVGHSGMGAYHGKLSFDIFSHQKSIVKRGTWLDLPLRYAPYKEKLKTIRKLLKWM